MPLEFLPDRFGDAKHAELDKAVNKAVRIFNKFSAEELLEDLYNILIHIVDKSDGELDPKYAVPHEAEALIEAHGELRDLLLSVWNLPVQRSYSKIRNLKILASSQALDKLSAPATKDVHQILSNAFKGQYRGVAVDGFYEYLTENEELFHTPEGRPGYYAKFCSIVQSSGTGKSRMLSELPKKEVITIYINLRAKDDKLSFPPRDSIASKILVCERTTSENLYTARCYTFFIALFKTVDECLSKRYSTRGTRASVMRWARQMCDLSDPPESTARKDFFQALYKTYNKTQQDLQRISKEQSETTDDSPVPQDETMDIDDVYLAAEKLENLFISSKDSEANKERLIPQPELGAIFRGSFQKMAASLGRIFPDHGTKPKMVIAIDEAHPLTTPVGDYRPADVFCRVVKEWSHFDDGRHAVWVVFASTTSKVADFSAPNKIHNSHRIANDGEKLFPPYTQLGWDQSAPSLTNERNVENVSQFEQIASFGRPLWSSLKSVVWTPATVLKTASEKLCSSGVYKTGDSHQVVAVLGQRFAVNITFGHPDSVEHLETGVASHLRVCLATTPDRTWRFTSYPSEPFLSCAAARILHGTAKSLEESLGVLLNLVNDGMIDMGQRGELASRLLWLLAKDLFVRTRSGGPAGVPSSWDGHLADCEMIPVVDWLEFIFGPQVWNANDQASIARESFKAAYLNFSHWVCMDKNIGSKNGGELPLALWTLRHWQRTSAVQCCHQQPRIDKVIPIYFKDEDGLAHETMSQIFISDKARESTSSKDALHAITRRNEAIGSERPASDTGTRPYIAILADLSQTPTFSVTFPEKEISDRCLRIYAAGVDTSIYPFLSGCPALMKTLEDLVLRQKIPETKRQFSTHLDARVRYGSTASAAHMEWERGSVPPGTLSS